ncbi:hypothetical protein B0H21DRAFT_717093 [Amylocystis lapponica]|nr:hypothetical protein B0H21DRAFT_717093 [Amylocystis lapponica]
MTFIPRLLSALFAAAAAAALHMPSDVVQTPLQAPKDDVKVPVTLAVMSRCPDALLCESVFDHVLRRVGSKVDMSLTFVGRINSSEPDFGVTCMHGPDECAGNVQELCAIKYVPTSQWWEFVQCQNYRGRDKVGLPETALQCAKSAKLDWEGSGVGSCAGLDGSGKAAEGVQLLQESVKTTRSIGVEKSCTIIINGKQVCIHDETWKQCEDGHTPNDFVRQINAEYQKLNGDDGSSEEYD